MSAAIDQPVVHVVTSARARTVVQPVTFPRAVRSEWIKMRSLRSTSFTIAAAVGVMVLMGWVFSWASNKYWSTMRPDEIASFNAIDTSLLGYTLAQAAITVLGVLLVTGEYSTGMIRATLAAVPRRLPVLWAKAGVFGVTTFAVTLVAGVGAFAGGQAFLGSHSTELVSSDAGVALVAVAGYLTLIGVLAVATGFILRNTAGAIALLLGLLMVLPVIGLLLPSSWQDHVVPYLPSQAGASMVSVYSAPGGLSSLESLAVLLAWVTVAVVGAAVVLGRRDA